MRGGEPITTWTGMTAKLREKYLPMSYRKKKPMTHQSERHRTNNHRYKSSPKPAPCSQPIHTAPHIHKSQIFSTTPVVPNSRPNLSLSLAKPKSSPRSVLLSQPIPFVPKSQPTPNLPLVQTNPTLQIVQPTPSLPLARTNPTVPVVRPIPASPLSLLP